MVETWKQLDVHTSKLVLEWIKYIFDPACIVLTMCRLQKIQIYALNPFFKSVKMYSVQ